MSAPDEDVFLLGWARHGRSMRSVWHRVEEWTVFGERVIRPVCGALELPPTAVVMAPSFDPGPTRCARCEESTDG